MFCHFARYLNAPSVIPQRIVIVDLMVKKCYHGPAILVETSVHTVLDHKKDITQCLNEIWKADEVKNSQTLDQAVKYKN